MLETGLSQQDVAELRTQRIANAARIEARADAQAALSLNVEDEEVNENSPLAAAHALCRQGHDCRWLRD